jgi:hypothetical protein
VLGAKLMVSADAILSYFPLPRSLLQNDIKCLSLQFSLASLIFVSKTRSPSLGRVTYCSILTYRNHTSLKNFQEQKPLLDLLRLQERFKKVI